MTCVEREHQTHASELEQLQAECGTTGHVFVAPTAFSFSKRPYCAVCWFFKPDDLAAANLNATSAALGGNPEPAHFLTLEPPARAGTSPPG